MTSNDDVPTNDDDDRTPGAVDLAPASFDSFIGQKNLKRELEVKIRAARAQNRPLGHLLLVTVPGAGKTTLARLIADKLDDDFTSYVCPINDKMMAQVVRSHFGVVLLDEIHRYSRAKLEGLLSLIGPEHYLQLASGAKLEPAMPLTIIGATTEPHKIIKALWDRFEAAGGVPAWDDYSDDELTEIVAQMSRQIGLNLDEPTCRMFGSASGGIPRHAEQFVLSHRDLQISNELTGLAPPTGEDTLALLRTSSDGISARHHQYLVVLELLGGTRGLRPIAGFLRVDEAVAEDLEQLLVRRGYVEMTDRGRDLTPKGYAYLQGAVRPVRRGRAQ